MYCNERERSKHRDRAPFPYPSSRHEESKIGLDDIEFIAATPSTSYTALNGGTFIKRLDFSVKGRPMDQNHSPLASEVYCVDIFPKIRF
jgi:hypothetical protein